MKDMMQPNESEFAPFYAGYISNVIGKNIPGILLSQIEEVKMFFKALGEEGCGNSYAPGKWTQKEVLGHLTDTDRIMTFRALSFARMKNSTLPGFDQEHFVKTADIKNIPLSDLLEDFEMSRMATVSLLRNLPKNTLLNIGIANGFDVSVRALFNIIAGHTVHHMNILKEQY